MNGIVSLPERIRDRMPRPNHLPDALHPVLARVYAGRRVDHPAELEYGLDRLPSPETLGGIDRAVALLAGALQNGRRILVLGDFDADGATSCALAVRALRAMGGQVEFLVPNRFEFGYGLTPEIVTLAAGREPDLLVTVDNGISSIEGVRTARAMGIDVLITDHHLPGERLPEAAAIVNPNQPGDAFPSKALAGVGVIFYVMLALRAELRRNRWFEHQSITEPNLGSLLDLVALGTVADLVPLDHCNRVLVAQGLARIRAGGGNPGIRALLRVAGRDPARVTAADLGFAAAPRLNAAGRLADMSLGVACLLSDDEAEADRCARELDTLNRERRAIEAEMQQQALATIGELRLDDGLPRGLCLFDERWHQGVVGLVASRIKDRTHRPVIAFAPGVTEGELKGSARSVPGLHIRDALDHIASTSPGMLTKFGGHAMAAGLSLPREHLEGFRQAFDAEVARWLSDDDLRGAILTDGELTAEDFSLELAEQLRTGGPWGQAFPEPSFHGQFQILDHRVVGNTHLKLRLRTINSGRVLEAIAFNAAPSGRAPVMGRITAVYRLDINDYNGQRSLQLVIEHLEPAGPAG